MIGKYNINNSAMVEDLTRKYNRLETILKKKSSDTILIDPHEFIPLVMQISYGLTFCEKESEKAGSIIQAQIIKRDYKKLIKKISSYSYSF